MGDTLEVLVTNDDGIDSAGIRAVSSSLAKVADVTVVAPSRTRALRDGRSHTKSTSSNTNSDTRWTERRRTASSPDLPNSDLFRISSLQAVTEGKPRRVRTRSIRNDRRGRRGGVFDVPAIATSMYVPIERGPVHEADLGQEYAEATRVTTFLAENALEASSSTQAT